MEEYRVKLKLNNFFIAIAAVILAIFSLLCILSEADIVPAYEPVAGNYRWYSTWRGFCAGASAGVLGVILFFLVRNIRALRDETKLKKVYIQEHDERRIQLWTKAQSCAMQAFLLFGLVAAIIAGYFSPVVSITIVCCIFFTSVAGLFFKIYWNIKL